MTYYKDLTPYVYGGGMTGAVNVGWLSLRNIFFRRGDAPDGLVENLSMLAFRRDRQSRGFHECPFCKKSTVVHVPGRGEIKLGSAEILVRSGEGRVYVAPNLVIHYIDAHSYLPPQEFMEAVLR